MSPDKLLTLPHSAFGRRPDKKTRTTPDAGILSGGAAG
jgi:hypothetical protein